MTEWWTYQPSDFLMFSSRVYYRQIESFNMDHWPLHIGLFAAGLYLLFACWSQRTDHIRVAFILIAAIWAFVSLDYLRAYLLTIHWGVIYVVYAFLLQAALLFMRTVSASEKDIPSGSAVRWIGMVLISVALILFPCISIFTGRGYVAAEVLGAMPTPTALATLGLLLGSRPRRMDIILMLIPILWCLLDAVTTYTMRQPDWWAAPAMIVAALAVALVGRKQRTQIV